MAYTLEEIYLTEKEKYNLKLLAGAKGIKASVSWVHVVETTEYVPFLKRRELVVTTGICNNTTQGLIDLARQLKEKNVTGLIINMSSHIENVPPELIAYCDEINLPLFSLPWEVCLVEISHDICRNIVLDENDEVDITKAFLDGIMFPAKRDESIKMLSRHGYEPETVYQLIAICISDGDKDKFGTVLDDLYYIAEGILNRINDHYILFIEKDMIYAALANYNPGEAGLFVKKLSQQELHYSYSCYCGVNPQTDDFDQLAQYFDKSHILLRLARARHIKIAYYENMDIFNLLLSVRNTSVLEKYHEDTIGVLKSYDSMNDTHFFPLLKQYFEYEGKVRSIADDNFVHRNTIHYQLNKIENIMGIRLDRWDDRLKIQLGLMIDEII